MTDRKPRYQAADAISGLNAAKADLAGVTEGLDPRVVLAPSVERERLRCKQVLQDRYRAAADLVAQLEEELATAEPMHAERIRATGAALASAYDAYCSASAAAKGAQQAGNSTVDGLREALGILRPVVAKTAREFQGLVITVGRPQGVA